MLFWVCRVESRGVSGCRGVEIQLQGGIGV